MKRIYWGIVIATALALVATPCPTVAQTESNPVSNHVRQVVEREAKNIVAAAQEMPADKYSYHPTPEQMTFSHLVAHMANSNTFLCSKISGVEAPKGEKLSDSDSKEKLVAALKGSFDFCTSSLAKVDDSNLGEQLTIFGGRKMSRAAVMITLTDDFYDHYSMAAMYLRLNGLLPPTAQREKKE